MKRQIRNKLDHTVRGAAALMQKTFARPLTTKERYRTRRFMRLYLAYCMKDVLGACRFNKS